MSLNDVTKEFDLSGQLITSVDPLKIGDENFSLLENYRYGINGIERCEGNSKINTTALTTNYKGRTGIQLKTPQTTKSRILIQEYDVDVANPIIKQNTTAVPAQGDFAAATLYTAASGAQEGRFSEYPNFNIAYCNEVESCVWAGDEMRVASFTLIAGLSGLTLTTPADYTLEVNNTLQTSGNTVALSAGFREFLVGSTRPLKAVKFYIKTANDTASTLTGKYWDGSAWQALTIGTDGTTAGGIALAQTGTIDFTSTVTLAKTAYIDGMLLYFYHFTLSDGTATIYHVTVDAPFQTIVDVWDGVYRTCIQFQVSRNSVYEDYTLEVNEPSSIQYPIAALIGSLLATDHIILMFQERMSAINWGMLAGYTNNAAATMTIKYWTGAAWATVGTLSDGTLANSKTLNQSGVTSWNPPAETAERPQQLFGVFGYAYQVTWSATLHGSKASGTHTTGANSADLVDNLQQWTIDSLIGKTISNTTDTSSTTATDNTEITVVGVLAGGVDNDWDVGDAYTITPYNDAIVVDVAVGIPAQRTIRPFKFPFIYKNRPFLCGDVAGKEEHRADYGAVNTADVYNGDDSSAPGQSLFFGSGGELTGASRVYNRFGSSILDTALFFKSTETFLLNGTYPGDYRIYQISANYGCPAPETIDTAEVGYEVAPDALRNISIWLSFQGPILFDAAVVVPIPGVEDYFDPRKSKCINFDDIAKSRGRFDPVKMEYNLGIPSGTGQTTLNKWLVLDLRRKRWYEKNINSGNWPQFFMAVEDTYGKKYMYAHIDTGYLIRVEDGTTWAGGETITHKFRGADVLPFGSTWLQSKLTHFKLLTQVPEFIDQDPASSVTISIKHYKDGETTGTDLTDITIAKSDYMTTPFWVNEDGDRIVNEDGDYLVFNFFTEKRHRRNTQAKIIQGWSHQFEVSMDSDSYDYIANYSRNVLGIAFQAEAVREDL